MSKAALAALAALLSMTTIQAVCAQNMPKIPAPDELDKMNEMVINRTCPAKPEVYETVGDLQCRVKCNGGVDAPCYKCHDNVDMTNRIIWFWNEFMNDCGKTTQKKELND